MATEIQFELILIFFVYGLAFFSLGLTMLIEAGRSPLLAPARVLRPLAVFGFVHGVHEWLELGLLAGGWLGVSAPGWVSWLRLSLLVGSFGALITFALQVLRPHSERFTRKEILLSIGLLLVYVILVIGSGLGHQAIPAHWLEDADAWSRYLLAVPGAGLAAAAFVHHARQVQSVDRRDLFNHLRLAGLGFGLYSLTQLFVPAGDILLAPIINSQNFMLWTGFPIQLVRTIFAIGITYVLFRATQIVEEERRQQLITAQRERLQAMQQIQLELEQREQLHRELLRRTVVAQEEERARISHELHDETAQFLTAMNLNLATIQNSSPDNPQVIMIVARLQTMCRDMSRGIHRMVHDLRPAQLDDLGLVPALGYLVDEMRARAGLEINFTLGGARQRLEPIIETVIFRVAQEALANVARHAGCKQADMRLEFGRDCLKLTVVDEGCGFDPATLKLSTEGLGLAGMRERVESLNGIFRLHSVPAHGTRVTILVPRSELGSVGMVEEMCNENDSYPFGG